MLNHVIDFFTQYYLHITAILPTMVLVAMLFSHDGRGELFTNLGLILYFMVTLPYVYLNIFTTLPHMVMPMVFANILHVILCFAVFMAD